MKDIILSGFMNGGAGGGSAGVTSWNDLKDRPFGEEIALGDTLTWDGNTDGLEGVMVDMDGEVMPMFYKISDVVPTRDECAGGMIAPFNDGKCLIDTREISSEELQGFYDMFFKEDGFFYFEAFAFVPHDNYTWEWDYDTVFPTAGIYMVNPVFFDGGYVTSLTIPGYGKFESASIKTIDPKFLPKVASVSDITTAPTAEQFNALLAALRNAGYMEE